MIKYLALTFLFPSLLSAQQIVYRDASQEKALIDSYLEAFSNNNTIGSYYDSKNLIDRLFNYYQAEVYQQALQYLDQQTSSYPQAVIALSDNLQTYWDSHYLQGYLLNNAGDYGKLKFFSILGMIVGGVGVWKNPFVSFGTLKSLNVLLPLTGGGAGGYAVKFFGKPLASPPEPQQFLRVANGDRQFSYAQKRNDYLYRLFSVGGAIASGDVIFKRVLTGATEATTKISSNSRAMVVSDSSTSGKTTDNLPTKVASNDGASKTGQRVASETGDEVSSLFKPALNDWSKFKKWLAPAVGTLFAMYAVNKASYYAMRLAEIKKFEHQLKDKLATIDYLVQIGDVEEVINAAQLINVTVLKLVTLYEMEHLRMIVDFETEFGKEASKIAQTDNDVRLKIEELLIKLTDNLPAKLTMALNRDNYRYADVGTIKHLRQLTYQAIIDDPQLSQQPSVASIVNSFHEERVVARNDLDLNSEFASYLQLLLADRYADAKTAVTDGKLQKNIEILFQVATVFKRLSDNQQFAFLDHFQHKLEAKFHNISLMYENFSSLLKRNAILREKKFSYTDLQATVGTYLDYHATDSKAVNTNNDRNPSSIQGRQLTSTRSFARFLAEFIGKSDTKTYNALILELLMIYQEQPDRREAVAVLLNDIEEVGKLHDSYYDSAVMSGIEGGFIGAFTLVGLRALAKLARLVAYDLTKAERFSVVKGFLGVPPWEQMAIFFAAGIGIGVGYHFIKKKLFPHKIYPKQALFTSQKLITFDLAQRVCLLNLEIEDRLVTDQQTVKGYSGEQIQGQRELLATFVNRVQQINQQVDHLTNRASQLEINHYLQLPDDHHNDAVVESCRGTATIDGYAVSLSPLRQDLNRSKSILGQHQRMLDKIEGNRANF